MNDVGMIGLPLSDNPGHLVRRLHQIAVSIFLRETQDFDLTPVQYAAMFTLRDNPGVDQRALARAIAFDRSTLGDVVQRLEKKGLVRRDGGRDRRTKFLSLTAEGVRVLDLCVQPIDRFKATLMAPLSEGEQHIFIYLLHKLVDLNNDLSRVPLGGTAEEASDLPG
jgi:DNA-binding MarR family transcriptional regulator